jgi:hypothetical protein
MAAVEVVVVDALNVISAAAAVDYAPLELVAR